MKRPVPMGAKPPSLTVIDIKPKGKPGTDEGNTGKPDNDGDENESYFRCPSCGASLCVEEKGAEDEGDNDGDEAAAGGMR